jgi:hypothetical protein
VEILPKTKSKDCEIQIYGYSMFTNANPKRGCAIYVKENTVSSANQFDQSFVEVVSRYIHLNRGEKLLICCIYRSPNSSQENNDSLLELLETIGNSKPSHLLILGDFNYGDIDWDRSKTKLEVATKQGLRREA